MDTELKTKVAQGFAPGIAHLTTTQLVAALKDGVVGESVLTDKELTAITEKDCRPGGDGYSYLRSAIAIVLRKHEVFWKRIPGAWCIKCLDVKETIDHVESGLRSTRRASKRYMRRLNSVYGKAADDERPKLEVLAAQIGTLGVLSGANQTSKMLSHNATQIADPRKLLEAMQKG